jgi:hypothetical protein
MFERVSQLAEQAATTVSRRHFLGRFGTGALAAAAFLGSVLGTPTDSQAARRRRCGGQICPPGYDYCCSYFDHAGGKRVHYCSPTRCP